MFLTLISSLCGHPKMNEPPNVKKTISDDGWECWEYSKPPKMTFLSNFWHSVTTHKTFLHKIQEREQYAQALAERQALIAALQEINQARREKAANPASIKTISDDGWEFVKPPKITLLKQVLMFCSKRYSRKFWHTVTMHKIFLHRSQEREQHAQTLAERQASFVALRQQNQARRKRAATPVSVQPISNEGWT